MAPTIQERVHQMQGEFSGCTNILFWVQLCPTWIVCHRENRTQDFGTNTRENVMDATKVAVTIRDIMHKWLVLFTECLTQVVNIDSDWIILPSYIRQCFHHAEMQWIFTIVERIQIFPVNSMYCWVSFNWPLYLIRQHHKHYPPLES